MTYNGRILNSYIIKYYFTARYITNNNSDVSTINTTNVDIFKGYIPKSYFAGSDITYYTTVDILSFDTVCITCAFFNEVIGSDILNYCTGTGAGNSNVAFNLFENCRRALHIKYTVYRKVKSCSGCSLVVFLNYVSIFLSCRYSCRNSISINIFYIIITRRCLCGNFKAERKPCMSCSADIRLSHSFIFFRINDFIIFINVHNSVQICIPKIVCI